jgi:hypothetical protein
VNFKFNPAEVTPQTSVKVASEPKQSRIANQTDAARIASAKARAMQISKENNRPGAQYGCDHHESYYQDFSGPETSWWFANILVCFAEILEAPILKRSRWVWTHDKYDPRTGNYILSDAPAVTIAELKSAIDARIAELGLSKVAIWEWFSDVREPIGQEWWRQDLATRIQRFRESN